MKQWIKKFFAVNNEVNEHTVMGVAFFVASLVAGFMAPPSLPVFYGYLGSCLTCFGLAYKKGDFDGFV